MKHKPPAFQFYPKQWLGDDNIILMDWDAQAMHLRLMCISWQQDHPGTLPNEEVLLRRWLRNPTDEVWSRVWPQINKAWQRSKKNPFKLYSRSLLRELRKQRVFSKLQSEKAKNGWKSRRNQADATASPRHDSGNARAGYALQSSASAVLPHTPPSGVSATPGTATVGRRADGTNPRALGTNPRAKANGKAPGTLHLAPGQDPWATKDDEGMSPEEMEAIKHRNMAPLPGDIKREDVVEVDAAAGSDEVLKQGENNG